MPASHSRKPFFAAARIPFTFTVVTTVTPAAYPPARTAPPRRAPVAATAGGRRGGWPAGAPAVGRCAGGDGES
ncbi:hypothetical protein GCM10009665_36250 [Kitasatospora nipponensis]|uniref:Uncharacterized protein n=1 Tax=Kitasatospora nipponensis TaxID=258049 RepID=A0ABN1WDZ5_9ACTN